MATSQEKVCSGSVNERTSQFYRTKELPERFENPSLFRGYDRKPQHPMYTTESSKYGSRAPTVHTVPLCFHATSQKFSQELGRSGMPRNYSLNTSMDKHYI
ncbi:unnamed protein product [Candidula unifasciata]|uniref:Uncharacterized protein n=1 Tax=Candidula unifasciata TaxID=100452 RepID=A0A8S3ZI57_9EUPU|nr:unnamed protein product [Candidula unifasciata]